MKRKLAEFSEMIRITKKTSRYQEIECVYVCECVYEREREATRWE